MMKEGRLLVEFYNRWVNFSGCFFLLLHHYVISSRLMFVALLILDETSQTNISRLFHFCYLRIFFRQTKILCRMRCFAPVCAFFCSKSFLDVTSIHRNLYFWKWLKSVLLWADAEQKPNDIFSVRNFISIFSFDGHFKRQFVSHQYFTRKSQLKESWPRFTSWGERKFSLESFYYFVREDREMNRINTSTTNSFNIIAGKLNWKIMQKSFSRNLLAVLICNDINWLLTVM